MASYTIPPEVLLCEIKKKKSVLLHRLEYDLKEKIHIRVSQCLVVIDSTSLVTF